MCLLIACTGDVKIPQAAEAATVNVSVEALSAATEEEEETDETALAIVNPEFTSLNGTLVVPPRKHASVSVTMGGVVRSIIFLPGEYVKQGTVMASLENPEFIELQQEYLEAVAQTEYLEAEYERQEVLSGQEVASKKRFQESKAEYLSMKSRKDAAAARLRLLGLSPESLLSGGIVPYLTVTAPLSGYVTGTKVNLGKFVAPGEPLCEIVDKGVALLCLTAYEKDLSLLTVGGSIRFRINGLTDEQFEASVISIGQEVDAVGRSVDVYARVLAPRADFRPGMYVTAQVRKP